MIQRNIGIYMILNVINGKIYIGQSRDIKNRWKQHKSDLNCNRHINEHLQSAWNKYGEENFEFIILCECEENQLNTLEQYYIFELFSYNPKVGYNNDYGGASGIPSEETKNKISKSLKGNIPWNKGVKSGQIPWNKGLKYNNPKISMSNKGKKAWNKTAIICLNTLEIFDSIKEASTFYNLQTANIHKNINKKINSCGRSKDGKPLVWRYYAEYINMTQNEIKEALEYPINCNIGKNNHMAVKVICLNTLEVFDSMRDAEKYYGIYKGGVFESCNNNRAVGKIKYTFMKYDEYLQIKKIS